MTQQKLMQYHKWLIQLRMRNGMSANYMQMGYLLLESSITGKRIQQDIQYGKKEVVEE